MNDYHLYDEPDPIPDFWKGLVCGVALTVATGLLILLVALNG